MASSPQPGEKRKAEGISSDAPLDNIVDIDEIGGDLVLVVGADLVGSSSKLFNVEKTVAFRVDYKTLARNSSVFRTMFDTKSDNYKPGTSEVGWTEHLPDDSPAGLEFLFFIAHYGGFNKLPQKQSFQEVFEIAAMAYKYDMLSLLDGRAKSWFAQNPYDSAPIPSSLLVSSNVKTIQQALIIAWDLGKPSLFLGLTERVICDSYVSNGKLSLYGKHLEDPDFQISTASIRKLPQLLIPTFNENYANMKWAEYWTTARARALNSICEAVHDFTQQLLGTKALGPSEKCPNHVSQNVEGQICESVALGTLMKALAKRGEWPLPEPQHRDEWTVNSIVSAWSSVEVRGFSDTIQKRHRKYNCDWTSGLRKRIKEAASIISMIEKDVPDSMKERASLAGL
ncbi:hypothetical protein PG984_010456 [Apiospora sp. TS-2023a]